MFPTDYSDILQRIEQIDPIRYAKTRNFHDGAVTKLSPYISRGVISTRQVFDHILSLKLSWDATEKLVQELAWRDYWQQAWIGKGKAIFEDLRRPQEPVSNYKIPSSIINGTTKIEAVDNAIQELYESGYMHNHMRMYVAAIACNMGESHWNIPSQWMYAHLLDGDLASNTLSWQWVAGSNANKKYYANQDNINKFFNSDQRDTFLDVGYEKFGQLEIPEELVALSSFELQIALPEFIDIQINRDKTTLIYNYYNLDPNWHKDEDVQRIFLLEPSIFERFPISQKCIDFALKLSENIPGIQLFVGEFEELKTKVETEKIIYKEHPLNNYEGIEESRDWLVPEVTGYFTSFFGYWKKAKKVLVRERS